MSATRTHDVASDAVGAAARKGLPVDGGDRLLRRIVLGTAATDVLSLAVSMLAAFHIRFGLPALTGGYLALFAVMPLVWLLAFGGLRLYGARHFTAEEEFRRVVLGVTIGVVAVVLVSYWTKAEFSRIWLGLTWTFALSLELATRRWWRRARARLEADGSIALRTLIVGANTEAAALSETLREGTGFAPVAYVGVHGEEPSPNGLPVLGGLRDLTALIRRTRAQVLVVAASAIDAEQVCDVAACARRAAIEMRISSRLPEVLTTRLGVHRIGRATMISVMSPRLTRLQRGVKRAFDVAVAGALLLVSAPLWLMIAFVLLVTQGRPVLYRQERITAHGRRFMMLKFRTMRDGDMPDGCDVSMPFAKPANDERVTAPGKLLRRFSLDELPQLVNVLRGQMSLVGPRPLPVAQVLSAPQMLAGRHEVLAGMTGWWQISGRSDVSPEDAARMDLFYVENWSLAYDLYILARTLGVVLRGVGAR